MALRGQPAVCHQGHGWTLALPTPFSNICIHLMVIWYTHEAPLPDKVKKRGSSQFKNKNETKCFKINNSHDFIFVRGMVLSAIFH